MDNLLILYEIVRKGDLVALSDDTMIKYFVLLEINTNYGTTNSTCKRLYV